MLRQYMFILTTPEEKLRPVERSSKVCNSVRRAAIKRYRCGERQRAVGDKRGPPAKAKTNAADLIFYYIILRIKPVLCGARIINKCIRIYCLEVRHYQ